MYKNWKRMTAMKPDTWRGYAMCGIVIFVRSFIFPFLQWSSTFRTLSKPRIADIHFGSINHCLQTIFVFTLYNLSCSFAARNPKWKCSEEWMLKSNVIVRYECFYQRFSQRSLNILYQRVHVFTHDLCIGVSQEQLKLQHHQHLEH